jgi:outer membrane lipoprotein
MENRMFGWIGLTGLLGGMAIATACTTYQVVPDHLKNRLDRETLIEQVEKSPEAYKGRLVAWGGEVLSVTNRENMTQVELLHLPLDRVYRPLDTRTASRGRFLAVDRKNDIKDAALLKNGTLVTVIGEVREPVVRRLDQDSYEYPTLLIEDMTAWEPQPGMKHFSPNSPFEGYRPFVFWDSRRVSGQ